MRKLKVLILGYVWPEPNSSAAGKRSLGLIEILSHAGHKVIFASGCRENEASALLAKAGVRVLPVLGNDSSFDSVLGSLDPDCVIFDRFLTEEQFGARVREACPRAMRVLDTVDLHFLRRARENALGSGVPFTDICEAAPRIFDPIPEDALRELASIYRSDLTLVVSEFESALLTERFGVPAELLSYFPLCYGADMIPSPGFDERSGFVMIGNFRHRPNADAVRWFKREIWDLIRKGLPGAQVRIYGAYPMREMTEASNPKRGFHVMGPVPSCFDTIAEHRVSLAPLRFGAGQKGKIADSWEAGAPVVTTPIGAEGMRHGLEFGGVVALDPKTFAEAAIELHENQSAWVAALEAGRRTLASTLSGALHRESLLSRLSRLDAGLMAARARNIVGAMLSHHQHASTKYFSRWIEAKNAPIPPG